MKTWTPDGVRRQILHRHADGLQRLQKAFQMQRALHDIQAGRPAAKDVIEAMPPAYWVEQHRNHRLHMQAVSQKSLRLWVALTHETEHEHGAHIHLSLAGTGLDGYEDPPGVEILGWMLAVFSPMEDCVLSSTGQEPGDLEIFPEHAVVHHHRLFLDEDGIPHAPWRS